jgi:hypothetical protein
MVTYASEWYLDDIPAECIITVVVKILTPKDQLGPKDVSAVYKELAPQVSCQCY